MSTHNLFVIAAATMVLLLAGQPESASAAKILLYPFGHCLNSHLLNVEKLGKILMDNGHDVAMLINSNYKGFGHQPAAKNALYGQKDSGKNNSMELFIFEAPHNFTPICEYDTIEFMLYTPISFRFNGLIETCVKYCEKILEDQWLLQALKDENFDLFITETLDPCSKILIDFLDVPFMPLLTTGLGHWDGNPRLPSYLPAAISPFTPSMTFFQRMGNFIMKMMYDYIPVLMGFDEHFENLKIKYNINTSLSIADTLNKATLKLVNSDFAIEYPAPIEPDTIMIGGFAIDQPKPLDRQMRRFLERSGNHGVILFSFGTLVKRFDRHWTQIFGDAFARLPEKVIWRYHVADNVSEAPDYELSTNVKLMSWVPQVDVLAHPKVKLLITHCGLNSVLEAAYFGVPTLGLPLSGDQYNQASKLTEHAKMGIQLDIHTLTSDQLYDAIRTIIDNPQYKRNALHTSRRMKDQPQSKVDKVNYWVDYSLRHRGAKHLKSIAHKLNWFQYFSLDVIGTLLFTVATVLSVILYIGLAIFHKLWYQGLKLLQFVPAPKQKLS